MREDLRVNEVTPGPHTAGLRRFLVHPQAMVGTDSTFVGEEPSPRTYGSYPRILGQFVREEGLLGLETAIAKMTSLPAARLGIRDRGRLADGLAADVVCSIRRESARMPRTTSRGPFRTGSSTSSSTVSRSSTTVRATRATPGRALRRGRD